MNDIKYGTVIIDSDPRGANIYVDGQILINPETEESIKTPAKVSLREGRRDIVLRIDKYDDYVTYIDVIPGTTVIKNGNLVPYTGKVTTPLESKQSENKPTESKLSENKQMSSLIDMTEITDKYGRIEHRHFGFMN